MTKHATPVGSGTVARTERISIERRAESAVIAWMRHQTTAYEHMAIPRVAGKRREVRRELATISRAVLHFHRRDAPHAAAACALCTAVAIAAVRGPAAAYFVIMSVRLGFRRQTLLGRARARARALAR